jgi:hypothetical protein
VGGDHRQRGFWRASLLARSLSQGQRKRRARPSPRVIRNPPRLVLVSSLAVARQQPSFVIA